MNAYEEELAKQRTAKANAQALSTDLFSGLDLGDYPSRPLVRHAEQRSLPIKGTIEGDYHAWRQTELGKQVYGMMRGRALELAAGGSKRIGMKAVAEWVRAQKVIVNNSYVALISRELLETEPSLEGKIEQRERTAT